MSSAPVADTSKRSGGRHRVVPSPLVSWTDVVEVHNVPGQQPTRSRLRALRERNLASGGVQVTRRGETGVAGTNTYHSTLSVWSARLRQNGLEEAADRLHVAASRIEKAYSTYLRAFLLRHDFNELNSADFYPQLVKDTADAFDDVVWPDVDMRVVIGEVEQRGDAWHVVGHDKSGSPWDEQVFPSVLVRKRLSRGSHVVLTVRAASSGLVVDIEAAVVLPNEDEIAPGPPFSHEEYVVLAARYRAGGGRRPSAEERHQLVERHVDNGIPRRQVVLDE